LGKRNKMIEKYPSQELVDFAVEIINPDARGAQW
jgi:hypothetical protein